MDGTASNEKNIEVLLVDDEENIRKTSAIIIEHYLTNVKVNPYEKPENVLDDILNKNKHYDLLITDFKMPGMTGIELLTRIYESGKNQKVFQQSILITGTRDGVEEYNRDHANKPELIVRNIVDKPFLNHDDKKQDQTISMPESLRDANPLVHKVYSTLKERGYEVKVA